MLRFRNILILALAAAGAAASGCLYGREVVREPRVEAPPPPPSAEPAPQSQYPDSSYQAEAPPPPPGNEVYDEGVFVERLSPYGSWTFVAPYGRVWMPAVGYGWRPYYFGRWVLTDWGWTFVSDDPWGWAAYHYGRWNWGMGLGWYWIPGRVWAPAWVSWRYGTGYAAWCPLGPSGVVFGYRHPAWVAVREEHFTRPISTVAIPTRATAGVVTTTQPLSGPHATVGRGGAFGPPVAGVQRATGQPVARVPASQVLARPRAAAQVPVRAANDPMRSPAARGSGGDAPRARGGEQPMARPGEAPRASPSYGAPRTGAPRGEAGAAPRAREGEGYGRAPAGGASRPTPAPAAPSGGDRPRPHAREEKQK
jgi:hypothetical protein